MRRSVMIEGYASLFGVEDLAGDVVRAGAFTRALRSGREIGMLLAHVGGRTAGRWAAIREDGRGLYVRGLVEDATPAGALALDLIAGDRLDGLSIGFVARDWSPRSAAGGGVGRELRDIDLREISLVAAPMLPAARFRAVAGHAGARPAEKRSAARKAAVENFRYTRVANADGAR
ncbi:HK97 family phage prohead protease [bacterium]|nr:HK97 family phage prohead protease [bacterium]